MQANKKSNILKIICLLITLIILTFLTKFAWAKYMNFINGTAQADIAQWNFNVTAGGQDDLIIDLADTRYKDDTNSVDIKTVAPGTSGKLILNINANVTDVSLKYDIDLDIGQIPQNLIFYSDSEMKNAIYHSNNNIHMEGFFACNENNKNEQKILYWKWPMETGQSEEQISYNDGLDSDFIGQNITLGIKVSGSQVKEIPDLQDIQVTFDANGGLLQGYGNAEVITKNLTYGEQYGNLPSPTREGYIFDGWISENLFDKNASTEPEIRNETPITHSGWPIVGKGFVSNMLKPNTQYIISYDMECIYVPDHTSNYSSSVGLYFDTSDHSQSIYGSLIGEYLQVGDIRYIKKSFTTPNDLSDLRMYLTSNVYKNGDIYAVTTMLFKNINIYQEVNPNTNVSIDKNHTLKAIWKKE